MTGPHFSAVEPVPVCGAPPEQQGTLAWATLQILQMGETIAHLQGELAELRSALPAPPDAPRRPIILGILHIVAADYGVPVRLLCADWRRADMVEARWIGMWIAREGFGCSLITIGDAMAGRDRTSIAHGVQSVEARRAADAAFRARTDRLRTHAINTIGGY